MIGELISTATAVRDGIVTAVKGAVGMDTGERSEREGENEGGEGGVHRERQRDG